MMTRRAMLLGLGLSYEDILADLRLLPAELDAEMIGVVGDGRTFAGVRDLRIDVRTEPIDVTSMGDVAPVYLAGLKTATFRFTCDPALFNAFSGPLQFCEQVGDTIIRASLLVTRQDVQVSRDSLATYEIKIEAVATGEVTIERITETARAAMAVAIAGRRAMRPGGLSE